jgi:hypothetical protein
MAWVMLAAWAAATEIDVPTSHLGSLVEYASVEGSLVLVPRTERSYFAARALERYTKVPYHVRRRSLSADAYQLDATLLRTGADCGLSLRDAGESWRVSWVGPCDVRPIDVAALRPHEPIEPRAFEFEMVRARWGAARREVGLGAGLAALGVALVASTAATAASRDNIEPGPWTGLVVANALGWVSIGGGGAVIAHGGGRLASGRLR